MIYLEAEGKRGIELSAMSFNVIYIERESRERDTLTKSSTNQFQIAFMINCL